MAKLNRVIGKNGRTRLNKIATEMMNVLLKKKIKKRRRSRHVYALGRRNKTPSAYSRGSSFSFILKIILNYTLRQIASGNRLPPSPSF